MISFSQQVPVAVTSDPPVDKTFRAMMATMAIPSHGAGLNALAYVAAGAGPHPAVILLHGFPGNEKNLDLAQAMRRAGWTVLYFNYRGSWGTPGDFSFEHSMEDTQAAIAYLRDPAVAKKLRVDSDRIYLAGHSMGGLMAAWAGAHDPKIRGVVLISAGDMAGWATLPAGAPAAAQEQMLTGLSAALANEGMAPLAGCTPASLARELMAHAKEWSIPGFAEKLAGRPVLAITSDDGGAAPVEKMVANIRAAGGTQVTSKHVATDHGYSDKRIELETLVLEWMAMQVGSR